MFDRVININCRHLWDVLPLISVTYVTFYTKLQIMTLKIAYNNASYPQPQEEKLGYYFQSWTCLGTIGTHVLVSFLLLVFCKRTVINVTLILKIAVNKIQEY